MNVSAVSAAANPLDPAVPSDLAKRHQDFNALQSALQSGNISSAQSAFASFLQDVQATALKAGSKSLFAPGSQPSKDLDALGSALKSANLAAAKQAFTALSQDVQNAWQPANGEPLAIAPPHHHLHLSGLNQIAASFAANGGGAASAPGAGQIINLKA
jgi:hypothetical protein